MRLSDFLTGVGRPIAYYPAMAQLCGGVTPALFLCQLIYWTGKGTDPEGWLYKTRIEMEDETGLSRREQEHAREELRRRDFLQERFGDMPRKLYFRVNLDALNDAWEGAETLHKVRNVPAGGEATEGAETLHKVRNVPAAMAETAPPAGTKRTRNNGGFVPAAYLIHRVLQETTTDTPLNPPMGDSGAIAPNDPRPQTPTRPHCGYGSCRKPLAEHSANFCEEHAPEAGP